MPEVSPGLLMDAVLGHFRMPVPAAEAATDVVFAPTAHDVLAGISAGQIEPFFQPLAMKLEVPSHDLRVLGGEDGADLLRRHLLAYEHALGPVDRSMRQRLRAAVHVPMCGLRME